MRNAAFCSLAATLGIAVTGYASPVNQPTVISTPQASASNPQEQTATSSLTAEEIGRHVLKLIDGIHSIGDISPARIEQVFGMKLAVNPNDPND